MKMGWKSSLLISVMTIFFVIANVEPILTTGDEKLQKRLPAFSLQKDMNNDRCDPVICEKVCTGYCMREKVSCPKAAEEDLSIDDEIAWKSAGQMNTSQKEPGPYYPHTECLCSRSAKQVKYSACYTENNKPLNPNEGGDYSQMKAFEECQLHCSMRVESSYTGRSDDSDDKGIESAAPETPRIFAALCDTNCNGRLQRFCYCVSFAYQPFPHPGEGWGEEVGWSSPSAGGHGWNSQPNGGHGWNASAVGNGWSNPPPIGWTSSSTTPNGWNPPPNEHPHPPSVTNGWNSPPSEHAHPPSVTNGWNSPPSGHAHPPSATNGWNSPPNEHAHPPSATNGWNSPPNEHGHPPSAPNGWTPPSAQPGSGWNSVATGSGWTPSLVGLGWILQPVGPGRNATGGRTPVDPNSNSNKSPEGFSDKLVGTEEDKKVPAKTEVIPSTSPVSNASTNKVPLGHSIHIKPSKTPEKGSSNNPIKNPTAAKPAIGKLQGNSKV